jgi:hypothetical protein
MAPVALKAQQDPHWPWFLMGVTAPLLLQSQEDGMLGKRGEGRGEEPTSFWCSAAEKSPTPPPPTDRLSGLTLRHSLAGETNQSHSRVRKGPSILPAIKQRGVGGGGG